MAAATGRFVSFSVVRIDMSGSPAFAGPPPARAVSPPRRLDPPSARLHRNEDWSDIEALLTARIAAPETAQGRSRRRGLPLLVSSALGAAVFAGLVAAAYLSAGCGSNAAGCAAPTARAPVVARRQEAASPAPTVRVAARPDTEVPPPVVQGRSVGEDDPATSAPPAAEDVPAASEPRRHRRHHRHRWWW